MNNKLIVLSLVTLVLILTSVGLVAANNGEIELTADEFIIDDLKSKVVATGNVKFSRGEMNLIADKIVGNQGLGEVVATGNIKFTKGDMTLTAKRLAGKEDLGEVVATGQVIINRDNGRLTGEKLKLKNDSNTGLLTGAPKLEREGTIITGGKFEFNLMNEKFIISKDAHLEDDKQELVADADRLEYDQAQQKAILSGNVNVKRGTRRMQAEKVIIDFKTKKMTAKGRTKFVIPSEQ